MAFPLFRDAFEEGEGKLASAGALRIGNSNARFPPKAPAKALEHPLMQSLPRPRLHLIRCHGVRAPNAKLRALVVPQESEPIAPAASPAAGEAGCQHHRPVRLSWAKLLKRVFGIDIEHCPNCGGDLKIIAAILEQLVIENILMRRGLQARALPLAPARGSQLQAA